MLNGREKVGAIIRAFALSPSMVSATVMGVMKLLEKLFTIPSGQPFIDEVMVLIPVGSASDYKFDCGLTRNALLNAFRDKPWATRVSVTQSTRDDLWWSLPNYGMGVFATKRFAWGLMLTADGGTLWGEEVISKLVAGADARADVIGVRRPGSGNLVSNTLALYRIQRLVAAGGFMPLNHPLLRNRADAILTEQGGERPAYGLVGGEEAVTSVLMAECDSRFALFEADLSSTIPTNPARKKSWDEMLISKDFRADLALRAAHLDLRAVHRQTLAL